MINPDNILSIRYPNLCQYWDYRKNIGLTPQDVSIWSHDAFWWTCDDGHEWKCRIYDMIHGRRCLVCFPYSPGVCENNCLALVNPDLTKEWHPTKNGYLTPRDVTSKSNKAVYWKCLSCGREWLASIYERTLGHKKCIGCRSVAVINPNLAKRWHPTKNGKLTPYDVLAYSNKKVWWICKKGHELFLSPCQMMRAYIHKSITLGCAYCSGKKLDKTNSLFAKYPQLIKEWNYKKNKGLSPHNIAPGSSIKVSWKCLICGSEWTASVLNRTNADNLTGCPYCNGKKINNYNSFASKFPWLIDEWVFSKNYPLTPFNVAPYSDKKALWKCHKCGNKWLATIKHRSAGENCPKCQKVVLKDGEVCDSSVEAFFYLLYKKNKKPFFHNKFYGRKKWRYDFYFPEENKYIEVTGYGRRWTHWDEYKKRIEDKRKLVEKNGAIFIFIQHFLKKSERQFVMKNIK